MPDRKDQIFDKFVTSHAGIGFQKNNEKWAKIPPTFPTNPVKTLISCQFCCFYTGSACNLLLVKNFCR